VHFSLALAGVRVDPFRLDKFYVSTWRQHKPVGYMCKPAEFDAHGAGLLQLPAQFSLKIFFIRHNSLHHLGGI
jgi:hypothetical protein